jgi:hypothetical protein
LAKMKLAWHILTGKKRSHANHWEDWREPLKTPQTVRTTWCCTCSHFEAKRTQCRKMQMYRLHDRYLNLVNVSSEAF